MIDLEAIREAAVEDGEGLTGDEAAAIYAALDSDRYHIHHLHHLARTLLDALSQDPSCNWLTDEVEQAAIALRRAIDQGGW